MNQQDKRHTHTHKYDDERMNEREKNKCLSTNTPYEQNYFAGIHFTPHLLANSLLTNRIQMKILTNRIQMTKKRNTQHISATMDKVNLKYGLQSKPFSPYQQFCKTTLFRL